MARWREVNAMSKLRSVSLFLVAVLTALNVAAVPAQSVGGDDSVGVADQTTGIWYLRSPNGDTTSFYFGNPGDYPIMGDWDCDGIDTPGLYRQSDGYVYLRNSNTQGPADIKFFFGNPGDIPLAGDFNADGCDTVSIYRPSQARIFVINKLGSNDGGLGAAEFDFYFGNPGDKAFTADFNNNGQDTVGLHRESTGFVYYRNSLKTGVADNDFFFGNPDDQIVTGRWVQNPNPGPDTVGIFRPGQGKFYLRFANSQGNANVSFDYGNRDMAAVAGDFGKLLGGDEGPPGNPIPGLVQKGEGVGDAVVAMSLPGEPVVVELDHDGKSNFIVWSLDASLANVDLLVNEIGSYSGTRPMQFDPSERPAYLEINADGSWSYEIRTLATELATSCTVIGAGDDVVKIAEFGSSAGIATLTHNGSSNFIVWAWAGSSRDLLVNEIGPYFGSVPVGAGYSVFDISSDGPWTVQC
ncbi:hypothetical protein ACFLQ7_04210 [Actinomycetota bacterium]